MFTELDRVRVRHALGMGNLFLQVDPRLEAALTNVQSTSDPGGTRPTQDAENEIKGWLTDLDDIQTNLKNLWKKALATQVDEIKIDCMRGMALLRMEGRRLCGNIASSLSTVPRHDVFDTPHYNPEGNPWPHLEAGRIEGGAEGE